MRLRVLTVLIIFLTSECATVQGQDKSKSVPSTSRAGQPAGAGAGQAVRAPQVHNADGISVEFTVEPISSEKRDSNGPGERGSNGPLERESNRLLDRDSNGPSQQDSNGLLAGTEARVLFKIVEATGRKGISNLRPAAWIDRREVAQTPNTRECREKVQQFLQPSFSRRPTVDLNSYFVLALNHEPNISVIDPLSGFGGSKLYTLIPLSGSGEDWVMSPDNKRLYVSMPLVNQVAVIDLATLKPIANIDAGVKPTRLALQRDGRYLWVGNDAKEDKDDGVTVIDTETLKVAARIKTGVGHHEIALSDDDSLAFVTNKQDGTLSVVDVRKLAKVADVEVGSLPAAVVVSSLSKSVYVANEGDGTIVALDGLRFEILARMKTQPGLRTLRVPRDGRFGFAVNRLTNTVHIFDVSSNRLVHAVPVGPGPDHITFTRQFAYVRSAGNEFVTMIKTSDLGKEASLSRFPAGQKAPKDSPASSLADAIVPGPEDGSVLVANPADKMIYFYTEGMAAPMGSFQNYRRDPKALLILDTGLREGASGVYSTTVRLTDPGHYDVAFLLDSPRVVNCFDLTVVENPALPKAAAVPIKIVPLLKDATLRVGERYNLRFEVIDTISNKPKLNLDDMGVLVFLAPGIWQQREAATPVGAGVYEMNFVPPQSGVYYVFFQSPSLGVRYNQLPPLTLQAMEK